MSWRSKGPGLARSIRGIVAFSFLYFLVVEFAHVKMQRSVSQKIGGLTKSLFYLTDRKQQEIPGKTA